MINSAVAIYENLIQRPDHRQTSSSATHDPARRSPLPGGRARDQHVRSLHSVEHYIASLNADATRR